MSFIQPIGSRPQLIAEGTYQRIIHLPSSGPSASAVPQVDRVVLSQEAAKVFEPEPTDYVQSRALRKEFAILRQILHGSGASLRFLGDITGGRLGSFVGVKLGHLVAALTGDAEFGARAGAVAGAATGGAAGALVGAALPFFCPYAGALLSGYTAGKDVLEKLGH